MSYDTTFRPTRYEDVLGQEVLIRVLREIIKQGRGFQQSYVFAGPWGGGKTTLARIFARALLCQHPKDTGDPCDECSSCRSFLEKGVNEDFTEVDAATNSGKDDIRKITDTIQFLTFSGKQRVYLQDEAHRLSRDALDSLLKPLEDEIRPGSKDKRLVCIFCTTEPEKMRATIFSRCAPIFRIQTVPPEVIAQRLAFVCEQENIPYEREALVLVSEIVECHIRDALKAIEGIALLGKIDLENTRTYLHLDLQDTYLDILSGIGTDLSGILAKTDELFLQVSPVTLYEKLAEIALLAYRMRLGIPPQGTHWNKDRLSEVGNRLGDKLIDIASWLSQRPVRPSPAMVHCDLAVLHRMLTGVQTLPASASFTVLPMQTTVEAIPEKRVVPTANVVPVPSQPVSGSVDFSTATFTNGKTSGTIPLVVPNGPFDGDPRGYRRPENAEAKANPLALEPTKFAEYLFAFFVSAKDGSERFSNLGRS